MIVVWSPDYDGKGKAWVRFDDGTGRDPRRLAHRATVKVGLLFPGEMGAAVGNAVRHEVLWASDGRSEATTKRAALFTDVESVDELVRASESSSRSARPRSQRRSRSRSSGSASTESTSRRMRSRRSGCDGSRSSARGSSTGRSSRPRGSTSISAGTGSDEVAALFDGPEVTAIPIQADVGAASALKMAFGGWNKIGIALTSQAHAIARAYGVTEWLESEGVPTDRLQWVADRAWRWAPEMDEIADMCGELGLDEGIPRGAASFYRELSSRAPGEAARG